MQLPVTLGKFQLLEKIGQGAFAIVYKGKNLDTKEIVAVKKMKKMTKQDAEMVKKEIAIMKDLKHKNIVQYIQDFREKGDWYIVLEYCGKGDMEQFKKKVGKIPEQHCKLFVRGILEALVQLHKKRIAHRDLKLANILINDDYKLKLADFGFSKDYEAGYMKSFCGTPLSMAPQILKRQQYNQKCDVWSLGILTYMMLYNKPPFFPTKVQGFGIPGITAAVTQRNHKFDDSVQVSSTGIAFMNDCLKKNMKDRPTTAQLLDHEWFDGLYPSSVSKLRTEAMKGSFAQETDTRESEANKLCDIMIFGVFEEHLKKISQVMQLNAEVIQKLKALYLKYYDSNKQILEYYILTVLKKLQNMGKRQIIYMLYDQSFKLSLAKMKKYKQFQKQIGVLADRQMPGLKPEKYAKVNLQRQIIKFCIAETEQLMDSCNDEEIADKLYLLKHLCKFVTTEYETTMVEIKWGDRPDFQKYEKFIIEYLGKINEEKIMKVIREEPASEEDLQSTWLIENHIKESVKEKKGLDVELGKLALYVLNIPSNFSVGKTLQTERIALNQEDFWPSQLKAL